MTQTLTSAGELRQLIVQPDVIDLRDREYEPALIALPQERKPLPGELLVRNQGQSSACTGFALASVIDRECRKTFGMAMARRVSTRMLFEMAKLHDDLPDAENAGSTLRGALKGFFNNGVCPEDDAPFLEAANAPGFALTLDLAEKAREVSLGAYYRLNHEVNDYHAAIAEAGSVIASAKIHSGWANPRDGKIELNTRFRGRHAFAIVGYDRDGFLVQNSWGADWSRAAGLEGVAHWSYEDWFENVEDAWVLRLAISSPRAFRVKYARNHKAFRNSTDPSASAAPFKPRRQDIYGHYLHIDDGRIVDQGRYAQTPADLAVMIDRIAGIAAGKDRAFDHLLLVAHGALTKRADIAARARAWLPVFTRNRIYPVHLMWETGFNGDVVDVIKDLLLKTEERTGKSDKHIDARLEALARPLGRKLWRDLKTTARLALSPEEDSGKAIAAILSAAGSMKLHFAAQSAGSLLFGETLARAAEAGHRFETAQLLAPACSMAFYDERIRPHVGKTVRQVTQYSLIDKREQEDALEVYGKSLLYLVSNAIEERCGTPILGLERDLKGVTLPGAHKVYFAGRNRSVTDADSHRGFDRDGKTMNDLLERITGTGVRPSIGFQAVDLTGF